MKKSMGLISIALIALIGLTVSCAKEPKEIKIGAILPLTGDAAVWGTSLKEGMDLALEEINENGGIQGKPIKLIYEDDKANPADGVAAVQKLLVTDKVKGIVGVANSSVALAIIPIITKEKVIFVSGGASSPKLTGSSPYFFRTWPSDIQEAYAMAKFAVKDKGYKNIAILYINNEYGIGLKESFSRKVLEYGGAILGAELFEQEATDFRTQISKIKALNPEAIYVIGNPKEMARCIRQIKELGIKTQLLSISTLNEPEIVPQIAGDAIEGIFVTDVSFDPKSSDPNTQNFISKFRAKYNKEPGILTVTGYDALKVLSYAMSKVGFDADRIAAELRELKDYPGAGGKLSFTEGGDVIRPVRIAIVKDGKFAKYADIDWK